MRRLLACVAILLAGCAGASSDPAGDPAVVDRVGDGDSLDLRGGDRVRLLQIDAPELGQGECFAEEALALLRGMVPPGAAILLERDSALDDVDRYGRQLRYLLVDDLNANVELVRVGAATPYFRGGEEGRYADELLAAVGEARAGGRGMWSACRVDWQPTRQVATSFR